VEVVFDIELELLARFGEVESLDELVVTELPVRFPRPPSGGYVLNSLGDETEWLAPVGWPQENVLVDKRLDVELTEDESHPIPVKAEESPILMDLPRGVFFLGIVDGLVFDQEELVVEDELVLASDMRLAGAALASSFPAANEELIRSPHISVRLDDALLEAA